jgi:hypothetical protein
VSASWIAYSSFQTDRTHVVTSSKVYTTASLSDRDVVTFRRAKVLASSELRAVALETLVLTFGDAKCEEAPNESVIRVETVRLDERGSRVC